MFLEDQEDRCAQTASQENRCAPTARQEAEEVDLNARRQVAVSHLFFYYKTNKEGSGFTDFGKP